MEASTSSNTVPSLKHIWLIRHGKKLCDVDQEWEKHTDRGFDSPLAPKGFEDAKATSKYIKSLITSIGGEKSVAVYASPFLRCKQVSIKKKRYWVVCSY
jgi:broad specificity phosphatase PhoE